MNLHTLNTIIRRYLFMPLIMLFGIISIIASGGGGGEEPPPPPPPLVCDGGSAVTVSWNANRETAVNSSGGGYVVYFSQSSGFNPGDSNVCSQDVPYVSGTTAPTSTVIDPPSGTWYVRVTATSQLNAPGTTGGTESAASSQTTVIVP